jgi:hypothetical protein
MIRKVTRKTKLCQKRSFVKKVLRNLRKWWSFRKSKMSHYCLIVPEDTVRCRTEKCWQTSWWRCTLQQPIDKNNIYREINFIQGYPGPFRCPPYTVTKAYPAIFQWRAYFFVFCTLMQGYNGLGGKRQDQFFEGREIDPSLTLFFSQGTFPENSGNVFRHGGM